MGESAMDEAQWRWNAFTLGVAFVRELQMFGAKLSPQDTIEKILKCIFL
jgi:hypothetical protein